VLNNKKEKHMEHNNGNDCYCHGCLVYGAEDAVPATP